MDAFGVRFRVDDRQRFETLRILFDELRRDKRAEVFRGADEWVALIPDGIKGRFRWPSAEHRDHRRPVRDSTIIAIPGPARQFGSTWVFDRVVESIDDGDYDLLRCELIEDEAAEMQISPHGYPYGGVGPLIALAEAFGFEVLGVNECGRFETR